MPQKRCPECGGWFEAEVFFRRAHALHAYSACGSHAICIGCEQTRRDQAKAKDRWPAKIHGTIRRHAARLRVTVTALRQEYGWQFDRMFHEAQHAYDNGC